MNIAYMALYGEGTDLLGYVLLQNMQLARATLDVELEHMRLGALLTIAANSSEPDIPERLALMSATLSRWRMPCTS